MGAVMNSVIDVEYEQPSCTTRHAWARVPQEPAPDERAALKDKIRRLLKERNAVMVSHYYVHPDLQDLAEETGGIVRALKDKGHKILWAPDKHLGGYIQRETGADMVFWNGSCIVHDEFKAFELAALMKEHPKAKVLVHPESPADVVALADAVGSTS